MYFWVLNIIKLYWNYLSCINNIHQELSQNTRLVPSAFRFGPEVQTINKVLCMGTISGTKSEQKNTKDLRDQTQLVSMIFCFILRNCHIMNFKIKNNKVAIQKEFSISL